MRSVRRQFAIAALFSCSFVMGANHPKVTITNTGSTNTAGFAVTLDGKDIATIHPQAEASRQVTLNSSALAEFMQAVDAAGPLHALPANHCMKSASFGSSLFVSRGEDRSPDLSCPQQSDPRTASLKKHAEEILRAAQKAGGVHSMRRVY